MRGVVVSAAGDAKLRVRQVLLRHGCDSRPEDVVAPEHAVGYIGQTKPDLVTLTFSGALEEVLALVRGIRGIYRGPLFIVGDTFDSKRILRLLREGADQYIDEADLDADFVEALSRLKEETHSGETGRLIALLSPSGGTGVSTVAVNIAAALAKEHQSCALLDMRLEASDLPALLDVQPTYTLADLCVNGSRLDAAMFERALVTHTSGIRLLASSIALAHTRDISADGVRQTLALARAKFPYVIADVGTWPKDSVEVVVRSADILLVVFRLDFVSLRNTKRLLEHLTALGISGERILLVANRYGQAQEISSSKAEEALRMKIAYYVPDEPKVINLANNSGVPAVTDNPKAKVCQSLYKLAHGVNGKHKK